MMNGPKIKMDVPGTTTLYHLIEKAYAQMRELEYTVDCIKRVTLELELTINQPQGIPTADKQKDSVRENPKNPKDENMSNDVLNKNKWREQHLIYLSKKLKDENYLSGVASSEFLHAGVCKLDIDSTESRET